MSDCKEIFEDSTKRYSVELHDESEKTSALLEMATFPVNKFEEFKKGNTYLCIDTMTIGTRKEVHESYIDSGIKVQDKNGEFTLSPYDAYTEEEIFDEENEDQIYCGLGIYTYKELEDSYQLFVSTELLKDKGLVLIGTLVQSTFARYK